MQLPAPAVAPCTSHSCMEAGPSTNISTSKIADMAADGGDRLRVGSLYCLRCVWQLPMLWQAPLLAAAEPERLVRGAASSSLGYALHCERLLYLVGITSVQLQVRQRSSCAFAAAARPDCHLKPWLRHLGLMAYCSRKVPTSSSSNGRHKRPGQLTASCLPHLLPTSGCTLCQCC